jgi:hypothetical protein
MENNIEEFKKEFKSVEFELQKVDEKGVFEGYASTFNDIDKVGDIVEMGAFKACLESKNKEDIDLCYDHSKADIIGEIEEIYENEIGLKIKGKLYVDDIQKAKEVYFLMQKKKLKSMSIGYIVKDKSYDGNIRKIKAMELTEISIVRNPVNPKAVIEQVKKVTNEEILALKSLSDIEKLLQKCNISSRGSVSLIAKVTEFKKATLEREAQKALNSSPDASNSHIIVDKLDEILKTISKNNN